MSTIEDAKSVAVELAPTTPYSQIELETAATLLVQEGDGRDRLLATMRYVTTLAANGNVALSEVAGNIARMRARSYGDEQRAAHPDAAAIAAAEIDAENAAEIAAEEDQD